MSRCELGDPLVDPRRSSRSTAATSRARVGARSGGSLASSAPISSSVEPDALGEDDERDPAQHRPRVAAVAGADALRGDQAALLVEAQGGGGDAAAARHLADREQVDIAVSEARPRLTSSSLELVGRRVHDRGAHRGPRERADHRGGHLAGRASRPATWQPRRVRLHRRAPAARPPARRPRAPHRLPEGGLGRAVRARAASTTTRSSRASPATRRARIETEDDVRDVIALLRLNYDRVVERYGLPQAPA